MQIMYIAAMGQFLVHMCICAMGYISRYIILALRTRAASDIVNMPNFSFILAIYVSPNAVQFLTNFWLSLYFFFFSFLVSTVGVFYCSFNFYFPSY